MKQLYIVGSLTNLKPTQEKLIIPQFLFAKPVQMDNSNDEIIFPCNKKKQSSSFVKKKLQPQQVLPEDRLKTEKDNQIFQQVEQTEKQGVRMALQEKKLSNQTFAFKCKSFSKTSFLAFNILENRLTREKTQSVGLLDEYGSIIFLNKLGFEHFEGCLNNLKRKSLLTLIISCQKELFIDAINSMSQNGCQIDYLMYSRNVKRRYGNLKVQKNSTSLDLYYRYLKGLTTRFKPVRLNLQNHQQIEGFWNEQALVTGERNYFLMITQLQLKLPNLEAMNLHEDPYIQKNERIINEKLGFQSDNEEDYEVISNKNEISHPSKSSVKKKKFIEKNKPKKKKNKATPLKEEKMQSSSSCLLTISNPIQKKPQILSKQVTENNLYQCSFLSDILSRKSRMFGCFESFLRMNQNKIFINLSNDFLKRNNLPSLSVILKNNEKKNQEQKKLKQEKERDEIDSYFEF